ncbi:hypothetical protein ACFSQ7_26535 [Paenibacillus rhizoplanae]
MQKAAILLQAPHLQLSEVSAMAGYPDYAQFSRMFKKAHGLLAQAVQI